MHSSVTCLVRCVHVLCGHDRVHTHGGWLCEHSGPCPQPEARKGPGRNQNPPEGPGLLLVERGAGLAINCPL